MKFSVAMCVYEKDNPEYFKIAVESIVNQTVKADEIVLVVDGPVTDELDSVIKFYENENSFKIIRLPTNRGHGVARDISLKNCSNDLVALMDADDISVETRFEQQINVFKKDDNLAIVGGNILEFNGNESNCVGIRKVPEKDKRIKEYMRYRCPFNQVSVMMKKSMVESVGGYLDWYCNEDYYLWLRLALAGKMFENINAILVRVRVNEAMYHRRGGWAYFESEERLQKYMLRHKIINLRIYFSNVLKRFVLQVMLTNKIREWVFKNFAREK